MESLATFIDAFHFLRPAWFFALLPAAILCWLKTQQTKYTGEWSAIIDPQLLPYMLDGDQGKQRSYSLLWLFGWLLAVTALAGPAWKQIPLPVHKQENALVVLFDLSPSMMAQDLTPDRLTRARLKLVDILNQRKEGTTALIAYSGDAFTVSPLTDDAKTVAALVPALHPGIMPVVGSNTEAAVAQAMKLLINAGQPSGDILIITDGISPAARETIDTQLRDKLQIDVSILAVGTEEGAPIPLGNGGFVKDRNGSIVIPALNSPMLKKLAKRLDGRFTQLSADDRDINYLLEGFDASLDDALGTTKTLERTFDSWDDQGFWLAILCLPLLVLSFRRGIVACLLLASLLSSPQPAMAFGWDDLWQRQDQQARQAFEGEDYAKAQELFKHRQWQAAAAYKNENYPSASSLFDNGTATADYNRGNALAKAGKLPEAIEAYQQALEKQPGHEDAQFNKELIEQLLQQQNQPSRQNSSDQNSPGQESSDREEPEQDSQQSEQNQGGDPQNNQQTGQNQPSKQPDKPSSDEQPGSEHPPQQQQTDSGQSPAGQQAQQAAQAQQQELSDEEQQAMEQWLRRIPDDPGGLLRKKFRHQSDKRASDRRHGYITPEPQTEQRW